MSELDLKDLLERAEVLTRAIEADWKQGAWSAHSTDYWQQCIVPITRKIPALDALVAELQARVDVLTGQVAGRDEQIAARDGHAECPNAANEGWCPWCRIAEQTEQIEQLQATLNVRDGQLTASRRQVAGRDATISWVRDLVDRAERHGYDLDPDQIKIALIGDPADDGSQTNG